MENTERRKWWDDPELTRKVAARIRKPGGSWVDGSSLADAGAWWVHFVLRLAGLAFTFGVCSALGLCAYAIVTV